MVVDWRSTRRPLSRILHAEGRVVGTLNIRAGRIARYFTPLLRPRRGMCMARKGRK